MDQEISFEISVDKKNDFSYELHLRRMQNLIFIENSIDQKLRKFIPLSFSAKNSKKNIIGGICGWISYDFAYVDAIWVDPASRKTAIGRELLLIFEKKVKAEFCNKILVTSNSYTQASEFWKKMNYDLFYELQGVNCNIQYFQKLIKL